MYELKDTALLAISGGREADHDCTRPIRVTL